jgi:hypothetical protein
VYVWVSVMSKDGLRFDGSIVSVRLLKRKEKIFMGPALSQIYELEKTTGLCGLGDGG